MGAFGSQVSSQTDSLFAYGTATAPVLGAAVATLSAPPAGLYLVRIRTRISTGVNVSVADNYQVNVGGTQKYRILNGVIAATAANISSIEEFQVRCSGSQDLTVNATASESALVTVSANIWAKKIAN